MLNFNAWNSKREKTKADENCGKAGWWRPYSDERRFDERGDKNGNGTTAYLGINFRFFFCLLHAVSDNELLETIISQNRLRQLFIFIHNLRCNFAFQRYKRRVLRLWLGTPGTYRIRHDLRGWERKISYCRRLCDVRFDPWRTRQVFRRRKKGGKKRRQKTEENLLSVLNLTR